VLTLGGERRSRAFELLLARRARLRSEAWVVEFVAEPFDDAAPPLDAREGEEDRPDDFRSKLTTFGQQDELGRRVVFGADPIGKRHERVERAGNIGEPRDELGARFFDALANRNLLMLFEELALTDVLEVHAYEVNVLLSGRPGRWPFLFQFLDVERIVFDELLPAERFRFFVFEEPLRLGGVRCFFCRRCAVTFRTNSELMRAAAPVEDVRLVCRVLPIDQRFVDAARPEGQRLGRGRRLFGHDCI